MSVAERPSGQLGPNPDRRSTVRLEKLCTISALLFALATAGEARAQDKAFELGKDSFLKKCGSCHSLGGGDRVGPDLKGVVDRRSKDWLTRFIMAPSTMLGSDPDAQALLAKYNNVRMPDLGLGPEEVAALIGLIDKCSKEVCQLQSSLTPVTKATPEDAELGRNIFLGVVAQEKGGPACISCHTV